LTARGVASAVPETEAEEDKPAFLKKEAKIPVRLG
jgi:hypothetical protein